MCLGYKRIVLMKINCIDALTKHFFFYYDYTIFVVPVDYSYG